MRYLFTGDTLYTTSAHVDRALQRLLQAHANLGCDTMRARGVVSCPHVVRLAAYEEILQWTAADVGVPAPLLTASLNWRAARMGRRLPQRFRDEIRGVSHGSD